MLRPVVRGAGRLSAEVVRIATPVSFLGDLDPESGKLLGVEIAGKILSLPYVKGSTVGPYVLWSISKRKKAPVAIVAKKIDLMLVTACVLAEIPLFEGEIHGSCVDIDLSTGKYVEC
ncbi:MAG: aconitase X swivel domain-containing protein [Pyrobaculum sp.]